MNYRKTLKELKLTLKPGGVEYVYTVPAGTRVKAIPGKPNMYWVDEFSWIPEGDNRHDPIHRGLQVSSDDVTKAMALPQLSAAIGPHRPTPAEVALALVGSHVITQHNLLSTASLQERLDTLERLLNWWNMIAAPLTACQNIDHAPAANTPQEYTPAEAILETIANYIKDGDVVDGEEHEMTIDDAFDTAGTCINAARQYFNPKEPL